MTAIQEDAAANSTLSAKPGLISPALQHWLQAQGYPHDAVDTAGENQMTPLMRACRSGEYAIVDELLEAGASLTLLNSDGNNALWLACYNGDPEIIERLIRAGVEIDHKNDNGATCLMYAASAGKNEVVAQLLAAGANPALESVDGFSALDMAATEECLWMLRKASKSAAA